MPLPRTEDPFEDDLGYGTAIYVVSTMPFHRITWGILKGILQGLQDFLVDQGRFMVRKPKGFFPDWSGDFPKDSGSCSRLLRCVLDPKIGLKVCLYYELKLGS